MSLAGPDSLRALEEALRDIRREEDEIAKRLARSAGLAILSIACERDADGGVTATLGEVH